MRNYLTAMGELVDEALAPRCPDDLPTFDSDRPFLVIGHRGAPSHEPENTIPSFDRALADGANALEIDLGITCDDHIVLWHDWEPDGLIAKLRYYELEPFVRYYPAAPSEGRWRRPTCDLTLDEFRAHYHYRHKESGKIADAHIPTFDEFVGWGVGKKDLRYVFLDVKVPPERLDAVPPLIASIKRSIAEHRPAFTLILETTEPDVLHEMKRCDGTFLYTLDTEPSPGLVLSPESHSAVEAAIRHGNTCGLTLRPRDITLFSWTTYRRIVEHDLALMQKHNTEHPDAPVNMLFGATINEEREMECLIRLGMHGIQTDLPGRLRAVADRLGVL